MKKTYFISGHRDVKQEDFDKIYVPVLEKIIREEAESVFVVGDYWGVDEMAQNWLRDNLKDHSRVTVYHMGNYPRVLSSKLFNTSGGYLSDIERDSEMTKVSDQDIAFIYPGKWTSGTAQNILRRFEVLGKE